MWALYYEERIPCVFLVIEPTYRCHPQVFVVDTVSSIKRKSPVTQRFFTPGGRIAVSPTALA